MEICTAVDHSARALPVCPTAEYCESLSGLTGLIRADYEAIALMEFLSLARCVIFLRDTPVWVTHMLCEWKPKCGYVGDVA